MNKFIKIEKIKNGKRKYLLTVNNGYDIKEAKFLEKVGILKYLEEYLN